MFPPRHAAGPGRRAMRMADGRDRNATPMSLALLAVCFAALSASRALRHATKARHATLHIEFDTERPTETIMPDAGRCSLGPSGYTAENSQTKRIEAPRGAQ